MRLAAGVLLGFHAWLLWFHAATGRLANPPTALRWVLAAVILSGFIALRRLGRPLVRGRKALVLWVLAALLHCHIGYSAGTAGPAATIPESAGILIQIAASPVLLFGFGLAWLAANRRRACLRVLPWAAVCESAHRRPSATGGSRFSPRAPPALLPA